MPNNYRSGALGLCALAVAIAGVLPAPAAAATRLIRDVSFYSLFVEEGANSFWEPPKGLRLPLGKGTASVFKTVDLTNNKGDTHAPVSMQISVQYLSTVAVPKGYSDQVRVQFWLLGLGDLASGYVSLDGHRSDGSLMIIDQVVGVDASKWTYAPSDPPFFAQFNPANPKDIAQDGSFIVDYFHSEVPEPGVWALLIAGFAVVGGVARGRRRAGIRAPKGCAASRQSPLAG